MTSVAMRMAVGVTLCFGLFALADAGAEAAQEATSPTPAAASPTPNATFTALQEQKLREEISKLKFEQAKIEQDTKQGQYNLFGNWGGFLWMHTAPVLSAIIAVVAGIYSLRKWLSTRQADQARRDEDRIQALINQLAEERELSRQAAAAGLQTFLKQTYSGYHLQIFELAVNALRSSYSSSEPRSPYSLVLPFQKTYLRSATVAQPAPESLVSLFRMAFPRARDRIWERFPKNVRKEYRTWLNAASRGRRSLELLKQSPPDGLLNANGVRLVEAQLEPHRNSWTPG